MEQRLLISFVGAPGVGKTTMCSELAKRLPMVRCILEDTDQNLYLSKFYDDPLRWSFHSRISIFAMHLQNYTKISLDSPVSLMDKCIPELIVYAQRAYELGHIDELEFALYRQLYDATNQLIPPIDLFVYLSCSAETCYKRMLKRGREFESNVSINYITDVINRYDAWAETIPEEKIVRVNTDDEADWCEKMNELMRIVEGRNKC